MESTVWFITGSSRGLGRALVSYALENGAKVVATARNPSSIQDLVDRYGEERILPLPLDVTDYAAAQIAVEQAVETFGRVDILINNAGYAEVGSVEDLAIDSIRAQIDTNLLGVINVSKAFIPIFRKQGQGHIFQISSVGSRAASPGLSAYQAAKFAVAGFSGVLALEVKRFGIRVTCVEPGAMPTEWAGGEVLVSAGYEDTVGKHTEKFEKALKGSATKLERVGDIVRRLFEEGEKAPMRMLVGGDAVEFGVLLGERLRKSDAEWAELGKSSSE